MQEEQPQKFLPPPESQTTPEEQRQQSVMLDVGGSKSPSKLPSMCGSAAHPLVALFHVAFLIGVVFLYLALPIIFKPFTAYTLIIVASAIDFYYIKNIAGRLLVGLRWWIQFTDDGQQVYKFESKIDDRDIPTGNQKIFWDPIYLFLVAWFVLIVLSIISFSAPHLFICIFNFALLKFNLNYFVKCWQRRGNQIEQMFVRHGHDKLQPYYRGSFISHLNEPKTES